MRRSVVGLYTRLSASIQMMKVKYQNMQLCVYMVPSCVNLEQRFRLCLLSETEILMSCIHGILIISDQCGFLVSEQGEGYIKAVNCENTCNVRPTECQHDW